MSTSPGNIVVLSHRLPYPPNKGEKIRTYNQLEHLRQSDCKVTIFCSVDSVDEAELARQYAELSGFKVVTVMARYRKLAMLAGLTSCRAFSVSNFYNSELQALVDSHLEQEPVDAVYCTSSAMAEYLFKSAVNGHSTGSPALELMDFMDLDSDKWRQYREISKFPMSLVYRYEESALSRYEQRIQRRFDACIFISSNEVDLFREKLSQQADNLHVVGNGVDLDAFRPPSNFYDAINTGDIPHAKSQKLKLLFSGVMDYLPNENAMLWFVDNVWDRLRLVRPDAELIIAGMNPSSAIQALSEKNGITVTGFVDDMLACYHDANLFVAPFQIARGVQNKVLQAFACGLPVVTTAVGAEGINCTNGVHYLLASTPDQFVDRIVQLTDDHALYKELAENAISLVNEKYTWDAMNADLFQLFEQSPAKAA